MGELNFFRWNLCERMRSRDPFKEAASLFAMARIGTLAADHLLAQ